MNYFTKMMQHELQEKEEVSQVEMELSKLTTMVESYLKEAGMEDVMEEVKRNPYAFMIGTESAYGTGMRNTWSKFGMTMKKMTTIFDRDLKIASGYAKRFQSLSDYFVKNEDTESLINAEYVRRLNELTTIFSSFDNDMTGLSKQFQDFLNNFNTELIDLWKQFDKMFIVWLWSWLFCPLILYFWYLWIILMISCFKFEGKVSKLFNDEAAKGIVQVFIKLYQQINPGDRSIQLDNFTIEDGCKITQKILDKVMEVKQYQTLRVLNFNDKRYIVNEIKKYVDKYQAVTHKYSMMNGLLNGVPKYVTSDKAPLTLSNPQKGSLIRMIAIMMNAMKEYYQMINVMGNELYKL